MAAIIAFPSDRQPTRALEPVPSPAALPSSRRLPVGVYRRRRLVVVAVVVGLVLATLSLGRNAGASGTPHAVATDSVTYVVQPGDTLWDIALELSAGGDPRPLVATLDDLAGGALLQPGQRLVVPADLVG